MAGLDSLPDAPTVARIVMAATGEAPGDLRLVGQAVTAQGWRAETSDGAVCVLTAVPTQAYAGQPVDGPQFEARAAVLAALRERDTRCPEPIATNRSPDVPESLAVWTWQVTSWLDGDPATLPVQDAVARDLGEVMAALHSIPSEGYGLLVDTADAVRGRTDIRAEAAPGRWGEALWPYDGRALMSHALVRAAPHLVPAVGELREQLLGYASAAAPVLCHTDLNSGDHIRVRDGRLAGVIDFGDAAIVPAAFDVASFASWAGWEATERFLEGYTSNRVLRDLRRAEAYQLAVVLALHKVHKHTHLRPDRERLQRAVAFLEATLPLAARRADA